MQRKRFLILTIAALALVEGFAGAAIPPTISYQGKLIDSNGQAVTGQHSLTFSIYALPSGGTAIWTETQDINTTDGYFNLILGYVNAITLPFDAPYYMGIKIDSGQESSPRTPVSSVPYAFYSTRSSSADTVADNSITTAKLAGGAVTSPKISPPVALTSNQGTGATISGINQSSGTGVLGESTTGIGVLARSTGGTALRVEGPTVLAGDLTLTGRVGARLTSDGTNVGFYGIGDPVGLVGYEDGTSTRRHLTVMDPTGAMTQPVIVSQASDPLQDDKQRIQAILTQWPQAIVFLNHPWMKIGQAVTTTIDYWTAAEIVSIYLTPTLPAAIELTPTSEMLGKWDEALSLLSDVDRTKSILGVMTDDSHSTNDRAYGGGRGSTSVWMENLTGADSRDSMLAGNFVAAQARTWNFSLSGYQVSSTSPQTITITPRIYNPSVTVKVRFIGCDPNTGGSPGTVLYESGNLLEGGSASYTLPSAASNAANIKYVRAELVQTNGDENGTRVFVNPIKIGSNGMFIAGTNCYPNMSQGMIGNKYRRSANLHCHTTNSDGSQAPADVRLGYYTHGYPFICITDHQFVTPAVNYYFGEQPSVGTPASVNPISASETSGTALAGFAKTGIGVYGKASDIGGTGVLGENTYPGRNKGTGVKAFADGGVALRATSLQNRGAEIVSYADTGLYVQALGQPVTGYYPIGLDVLSNYYYGIRAQSGGTGASGRAIYAKCSTDGGTAGYFETGDTGRGLVVSRDGTQETFSVTGTGNAAMAGALSVGQSLSVSGAATLGPTKVTSGSVEVWSGDVSILGGKLTFGEGNSSLGSGTISAGQSSLLVVNPSVTARSKIFVTFRSNPGGYYWISSQTPGSGFTIMRSGTSTTTQFDYFIVN